jgi:soluble lytic murein transglycosylase-like protein
VFVLALLLAGGTTRAGDRLYYYQDDNGQVIITNTPSRNDVKPVYDDPPAIARQVALPETPFDGYVEQVAAETGLSSSLIKAVALVESGFNPRAVSPKGAQGLMQLMPATAKQYGVTDPFDPLQNLRAGATHLRHLLESFDGDLTLALAAYNAGATTVRRHGGVPNYRETQGYVKRVQATLNGTADTGTTRRRSATGMSVQLVRQPDGSVLLLN